MVNIDYKEQKAKDWDLWHPCCHIDQLRGLTIYYNCLLSTAEVVIKPSQNATCDTNAAQYSQMTAMPNSIKSLSYITKYYTNAFLLTNNLWKYMIRVS